MRIRPSRRDMIGMTSAGMAALIPTAKARAPAASDQEHAGDIEVRVTAGTQRFSAQPAIKWRPLHASSSTSIAIDPDKRFQEVLGFGAAFTDASCYILNQLAPKAATG